MVVPPNIKKDKFSANLMSVNELENLRLTLVKRYEMIQDKELVKELHKNIEDLDAIINKVKLTEVKEPAYIPGVRYTYGGSKPEYCGSCHTKQTDITSKYCEGCHRDPSYNATTDKAMQFMMGGERMKFGTFEADYAEFQAFKEYMKFKHLSLNENKDVRRRDEERKEQSE